MIIDPVAFTLAFLNLLFIGLLPKIFFRKDGRYTLQWLSTALPFMLAGVSIIQACFTGEWMILPIRALFRQPLFPVELFGLCQIGATVLLTSSVALIAFTIGSHQRPLALWHQTNDAPEHLVTHGPYAWVRHPFYSAFLLTLLGVFILLPTLWDLLCLLYGFWILNWTASREEKRFLSSALAAQYEAYCQQTGRFFP